MVTRNTTRFIRILPVALVASWAWLVPSLPAAASSINLTIKAAHHAEIDFTHSERIFGKATTGSGAAASGRHLELRANPFPYKGFKPVATTTTSSTGTYSFKQSPTHNTRYRVDLVSDPSDHSSVLTVFVDASFFDATFVGKATTVHVTFKTRYPAEISQKGRPLYWYLGLNHASRLKHVSNSRFPAPIKPGLTKVSHTFTVPAGWKYAQWTVLWRDLPKKGLGRPVCLGPVGWDLGKSSCTPPKSVSATSPHR